MVIGASDEQRATAEERVGPQELRVGAFLQARIVLLNLVAALLVVQEEREVRVEIEERTRDEAVEFKDRAFKRLFFEIDAEDSAPHAPAVVRVDEAEPVEPSRCDLVERNLARRGEIIAAEVEFESERPGRFGPAQITNVIAGAIVALVKATGVLRPSTGFTARGRCHKLRQMRCRIFGHTGARWLRGVNDELIGRFGR